MKRSKIVLVSCLMAGNLILNAQEAVKSEKSDYFPPGMYVTFEDFIAGRPTDTKTSFTLKIGSDSIAYRFYDAVSGDRIKRVFAVSHEGYLYVRMKDIMKHRAKEDQNQLKDDGDYHLKAIDISPKYIYFEDYFTSSAAILWGGAIATAASRRLKGLVYDQESRKFNVFKNSKDFENYIRLYHPDFVSQLPHTPTDEVGTKRKPHHADIELVRNIIFEVNQQARSVN